MLSASVERALATLGAGLCQSAWQSCLIAVVAAIALATFRRTTARDRYAILGSALMLVVLALCVETYHIAVFGTGSALGMAALSTFAGSPIARFVHQRGMSVGLSCVSGVLSIAYGVWSGSPMFVHLFSR